MLEKQEWTAVLILLLVIIICGAATLLLTPLGKEPFSKPFQKDLPDGTLVQYSGTVAKATLTKGGDYQIVNISGVQVFAPAPSDTPLLTPGQYVRIIGTIQTYKGKKEIVVDSGSDIISLEKHQG